jgi:cold shock CspA family protein
VIYHQQNLKKKSLKKRNQRRMKMKGIVKYYDPIRGLGFVNSYTDKDMPEVAPGLLFKEATIIGVTVKQYDNVEFDVDNTKAYPKAINVKKV